MGFVRAAVGGVGGTFAEQWKDFLTVPSDISPTVALCPAVPNGQNSGRGANSKSSQSVISNGSKVVVPEGYGLLLFQDGKLTAFVGEPGGYVWDSESPYSQSVFAGDAVRRSLVTQSWERFKFGGRPGAQQLALFVCLKELPNNKFGTQAEVYWDDAYFNAQVGVITYGTYSLSIVDPITFAANFVPAVYLQGLDSFDFTDRANPAANQLFSEVVGSLAAAFSLYSNDPTRPNRISRIQQDAVQFAQALSRAVDDNYQWQSGRGLTISKVTILGIEYDEQTKELLKTVQRADALSGSRGSANLQASLAQGFQSAGAQGGSEGILGVGIAAGAIGLGGLAQQPTATPPPASPSSDGQDLVAKLESLKRALDAGLIDQSEYDAARSKALGL
ncbi:MAG: SPFH domain-containing protein [Actinomycetales bacterium]|nr:SPFH domain-containing protein [Actinomycetales bacterium]